MKPVFHWAIFIFFSFPSLASAEQFGTVSFTMDGVEQEWFTISEGTGEDMAASASLKSGERLSNLSIQAHPAPKFSSKNVLDIDLTFFGANAPDKAPNFVDVIYTTNGMRAPFYSNKGSAVAPTATVEFTDEAGNLARIKGTFTATLCLAKDLYGDVDTSDCRDVSGSFDTGILLR